VVLVNPSVEAKTIPELIALAKRDPGKLNYASAGTGSGIHLGAELLAHMAGIKLTHIPYKGSAPALTDLLGEHVAMYLASLPPAVALVRDGKVRALAVTGPKRSPVFRIANRCGGRAARLRGRAALRHRRAGRHAEAIIEKLSVALKAALKEPDVRERSSRWRGACVDDAGRICRRHRSRGDEVVGDREVVGGEGGVT